MTDRKEKKYLLAKVLLVTFSFLFALVLSEVVVRFFDLGPKIYNISIKPHNKTNLEGEYQISPNRKLIYEPKPNSGKFNSYGSRGPEITKPNSQIKRIFFVGDSVVFGLFLPYRESFTSLLSKKLGSKVEVFNFSAPGYNFYSYLEVLKTKVLKHKPDLVLIGLCGNDFEKVNKYNGPEFGLIIDEIDKNRELGKFSIEMYKDFSSHTSRLAKLLFQKSYLYRFVQYTLFKGNTSVQTSSLLDFSFSTSDISSELDKVKALAAKNGFELIYINLPNNNFDIDKGAPFDRYKSLFKEKDIPVWDIYSLVNRSMNKEEKSKLFLPYDSWHLNIYGHEYVAKLLSEKLDQ